MKQSSAVSVLILGVFLVVFIISLQVMTTNEGFQDAAGSSNTGIMIAVAVIAVLVVIGGAFLLMSRKSAANLEAVRNLNTNKTPGYAGSANTFRGGSRRRA